MVSGTVSTHTAAFWVSWRQLMCLLQIKPKAGWELLAPRSIYVSSTTLIFTRCGTLFLFMSFYVFLSYHIILNFHEKIWRRCCKMSGVKWCKTVVLFRPHLMRAGRAKPDLWRLRKGQRLNLIVVVSIRRQLRKSSGWPWCLAVLFRKSGSRWPAMFSVWKKTHHKLKKTQPSHYQESIKIRNILL